MLATHLVRGFKLTSFTQDYRLFHRAHADLYSLCTFEYHCLAAACRMLSVMKDKSDCLHCLIIKMEETKCVPNADTIRRNCIQILNILL